MAAAPFIHQDPIPYLTSMTDDEIADLWHSALGQEIQIHRKKAGLNQDDAHDRTGISSSMISKIERGQGTSLATYLKICRALDIDFTSLCAAAELVVKARQISLSIVPDDEPDDS